MSELDIAGILNGLFRRKAIIIAVFLVVSSLGSYLAFILPDMFRSSTLIVITPQRLPASFVTSTVTTDVNERMQSIIQEILSRTQLEKLIREFDLTPGNAKASSLEERIDSLRKQIKIDFRKNNVFQLSFASSNPETAKQVTSRLASLFIEQNLQVREQQAMGTKSFINSESERLRKELEEQESVVNRYKASNLYELPDQLNTNISTLEQLRRELEASNTRLASLQERKNTLQTQSVESDIGLSLRPGTAIVSSGETPVGFLQYELKRKELESLLQKYSSKHPDVLRLKKEISGFDGGTQNTDPKKAADSPNVASVNPLKQVLNTQIRELDFEVSSVRSHIDRLRSDIAVLQNRVNNTPVRAIELTKISRGYEITLRKYQDLLAKGMESELSENMEKKQKGEQFQLLDPANFPLKPFQPNRLMIVFMGLAGGIAGGVGLALLWENLDRSFKGADEFHALIDVPLLATLPALVTRGSILEQRRAQGILVLTSVGALGVGLIVVRVFGPLYF